MPSGNPMTTFLNTLITQVYSSYYAKLAGLDYRWETIDFINSEWSCLVTGDDNVDTVGGRENMLKLYKSIYQSTMRTTLKPAKVCLG